VSIPTFAQTAKHRINLKYVNKRMSFDIEGDFYLNVVNDGSWKTHPVIEAMKKAHPAVVVLQQGVECSSLGIKSYDGCADTCYISKHRVSDRNNDFVNYGSAEYLAVGKYSLHNRALVRFDLKDVPESAKAAQACLQIYMFGKRRPSGMLAYEVLKPWGEGRGTGSRWIKKPVMEGEASWLCHQYPSKWAEGGCSAPGKDRSDNPVGEATPVEGEKGWASITIDPKLVKRWIEKPETNLGLLLTDKTESNGSECRYRSREFEDSGMRPRLVVAFSRGVKASAPSRPAARIATAAPEPVQPPEPEEEVPEGLGVIHLKDGTKLVVKRFWPCGKGVCYILPDGEEGSISFSKVLKLDRPGK
jgi:hypothetical protein